MFHSGSLPSSACTRSGVSIERPTYNTMVKSALFALLLAFLSGTACAELLEGRDYVLIPPQQTEARDRIEVTEFFWYGCPHCYDFEPILSQWLKKLPQGAVFRRIPAIYPGGRWAPAAKLFYALETVGEAERLHGQLFDAIHVDRMNYTREADVTDWLEKKGVDRKKFSEAYNSPAVKAKVERSLQLTEAYRVSGVPMIVIAGKYQTSNTLVGSFGALPVIMDELIAKAAAEQGKK